MVEGYQYLASCCTIFTSIMARRITTLAFQQYFKYHAVEPRHTLSRLFSKAPLFKVEWELTTVRTSVTIGRDRAGG